jgi:hypothetical protein
MRHTRADVQRQFDATTFSRGDNYAREGRVGGLRFEGDKIHAEVAGSGRNHYRQVIRVLDRGGVLRFEGDCSCPMSYNCKHVVAALLTGAASSAAAPALSALPASAEQWLRRAGQARAMAQGDMRPARTATHRLLHVMVPDGQNGQPLLHLCKGRLRKDGSIAAATLHDATYDLLASPPAWVRPQELETVRVVAALGAGRYYVAGVEPVGTMGAQLLDRLCAAGELLWADNVSNLKRGMLDVIGRGPNRRAAPDWRPAAGGDELLRMTWLFEDGAPVQAVLPSDPVHYLDHGVLGELALPAALARLPPKLVVDLVADGPALRPQARTGFAQRMAEQGLHGILPLPHALETRLRRDVAPTPELLLDSEYESLRNGVRWHDYAQLSFTYDGIPIHEPGEPTVRRVTGESVELIERDHAAEEAAAATLAGLGFMAPAADSPLHQRRGTWQLPTEADWVRFVRFGLPQLEAARWQIVFDGNYRYELSEVEDWYAELDEEGEGGNAWFALELGIVVDGERHPLAPLLLEAIRMAPRDFTPEALAARDDADVLVVDVTPATRVALPWSRVKPILTTLGELYFADHVGDGVRLPVMDAARLAELERAASLRWIGGERLRELGRKLGDFDGIRPVAPPAGLRATLRDYQRLGLAWMQFLREYGFGGILADDMGLGKTIQTLAHILVEKDAGRLDAPALVVAPTSLMGNWQAEAARFAPDLRVLVLHGKERLASFDAIADADLVLTTYPLLGRDEAALRKHRYHLLILDEAQYIKNSRSKAAQTACLLDARHRLCLTGTPVQNHLGELWSQFHFLMPGLLGDEKQFTARFRKPIEQQGDTLRRNLLARRLKPFMLRRTKDKVATELPPKTEIMLPVDLGGGQRDLYETVRLAMDRKVRAAVDSKGLARSQIVILDALLKLRQVCCDPRLVRPALDAASAKLDALLELLTTLLSEGRKVLVFSQFTSMLALIEDELCARDIDYLLLTGDTEDRTAPVVAFQQGQVGVFLISLKAGGVGLNLTAADTVIHYDPWWNPASEQQATDRAWRIGQEQPVFVYKLIARGTVEEKIQDLQRRKGDLAQALLAPESGLAEGIGPDDLRAIFSAG